MKNWLWFVILSSLLGGWASTASAQSEPRFAVVIGNQEYSAPLGRLNQLYSDIKRIGDALGVARFSVQSQRDLDRSAIFAAVGQLAQQLKEAGPSAVGFFYYSGHGASANVGNTRKNYLIPSKSSVQKADDLVAGGVALDDVISILSGTGAKAVFIVFDACRTELPWSKGGTDPDKAFNVTAARPGLLIAFATDAGASAPDDGLFSTALASELVRVGEDHLHIFDRAVRQVGSRRGTDRLPWFANQIGQEVIFVPGVPSNVASRVARANPDARPTNTQKAAFGPYALEQLPAEVRTVVADARQKTLLGEAAMNEAQSVADRAAVIAKSSQSSGSYRGQVSFGRPSGLGQSQSKEGAVFTGQWTDGRPNGYGIQIPPQSTSDNPLLRSIGRFSFGRQDGPGGMHWANGDRHVGSFTASSRTLIGTLHRSSGIRFEGHLTDGKPDGLGAEWAPDGQLLRAGHWTAGVRD